MPTREMTIILGDPQDKKRPLLLRDVSEEFVNILNTLKEIGKSYSRNEAEGVDFKITRITMGSPIECCIEEYTHNGSPATGQVITRFVTEIDRVKQYGFSADHSPALRNNLAKVMKVADRGFGRVVFSLDDEHVELSGDVIRDVIEKSPKTVRSKGSFVGTIELLNVHNKLQFRLYPVIGPTSILCSFDEGQYHEVYTAIKARVRVFGTVVYVCGEKFPSRMTVDRIDKLKQPSELPSFDDLMGIAKDATGDMSSEQFVRRLRDNGW